MASIKVLAGDFVSYAPSAFTFGSFVLTPKDAKWGNQTTYNPKTDIVSLEVVNEQNAAKVGGALGLGAVGALVAGPVGAIVGGILGGRGKDVTFAAEFRDGKKLLGKIDAKAWEKVVAARF
jgi:hypothetical protein